MRAKAGIFGMKKIKGIGFGRHDFLKIHLAIRASSTKTAAPALP